jgi:hypothetical protein
LADRFLGLVVPWTVDEYPGRLRFLEMHFGLSRGTIKGWLYGKRETLPGKHARALALMARERGEALLSLAGELEEHADRWEVFAKRARGALAAGRDRANARRSG